jgi:protein SCO1/2
MVESMLDTEISRRWLSSARLQTAVLTLFFCAFLSSTPAEAVVPQHQHDEPAKMAHDLPAGMDHAKHGETTPALAEHVPPVAVTEETGKVGLDEALGAYIPLDLTFHDEQRKPVKLSDLVTKPTIIAPVYYRCPNVCHFLQGDMARVLPGLKLKAGEDYQVISFSFDETERPELAERSRNTYYAAMKNQYPDQAWRFLTGDVDTIRKLTDAAGYHFQRVDNEFLHPVVFFVVSAEGQIIRYLHGTHIVPKDLTLALYEAKAGHVGTTIRKMVQYCFSFDPEQKTYVFNILRVSATAILATLAIFAGYLMFGGKKSKKDKNL